VSRGAHRDDLGFGPVELIPAGVRSVDRGRLAALAVLAATVVQLLVAVALPDLPRFHGKAFAARLVAYPVLMLAVPAAWALHRRRHGGDAPLPWDGFALLMAPFLIDVTGNTLNLYDSVASWDDLNHLVNWFLLCAGAGRLLRRAGVRPAWTLGLLVAGLGALLAIGWELAEYLTFIRGGTELDTAYRDTLGDEALGCTGAILAALLTLRAELRSRRHPAG
jgi:hypothetical protein